MTADAPAPASSVPPPGSPYWRFYEQVAREQLAAWLPEAPQRVLDLSGGGEGFARQLADAGHQVVLVREHADGPVTRTAEPGVSEVRADPAALTWLRDASVDAVLAESQMLSLCLATEVTAEHLFRVLRPGGRLLLVVDSLVTGLARLADLGRWAELADVPAADVVLVPAHDGRVTRCFWPEELEALLVDVGLEVEWVRPRSVLSPATVERALASGGDAALRELVRTELALAADREGESSGMHLVASARRP